MNRAIFRKLLETQPGEKGYIYLLDDFSMSEAVCAAGYPAVFLSRNDQNPAYFTWEAFETCIRQKQFTGTHLTEYTYILACKRKQLNEDCRELLRSAGAKVKEGWKLFAGKEYLSDQRFDQELKNVLERFERSQKGPDSDMQLKDRFCLKDRYGNRKGINDKELVDYLMETQEMFVCMGSLYLYEDGVYTEDVDEIRIRNIIQRYLYTEMIRARTLSSICSLLLMQEGLQRPIEAVNQYPITWINFKNGMLDAETMELHPHSPSYYSINQIPHRYVPEFVPEKWIVTRNFLQYSAVAPDDIRMLLTYAGLCMTRDTRQQVFLMLKGEGGTGKSRVIHLIEHIVGRENTSSIPLQDLNKRFYPTALFCKLLNSCADISSAAMEDVDTIKKATGEDILMYEKKGMDPGAFFSYAKLLFSANKIPMNLDEKSNAYYRRLLIYEMNRLPEKEDRMLDQKLEAEVEMTINRAVWALHEMYASSSGKIIKSANSQKLVNKQRMDADSVEAFLQEETVRDSDRRTQRGVLFEAYRKYCEENERVSYKKRQFFTSLEERRFQVVKIRGEHYFQGIILREKGEGEFLPVEEYGQTTLPF
ncbi:MAG: DNA primase [Lachnospiraceae bacterium]|nr:DNA primase [Lachnospiraceae bacterium]